ncbi:MAG: Kelch repeat-containing protein [Planctomycetota bacterium]|jgi:N-acetylneuraminic acid mutarotase
MHDMNTGRRRVARIGGFVLAVTVSEVMAGQPGSWSSLADYPTTITNNAVTSVCDQDGCTIYSFMGMTVPTNTSSVTAASYKLASPGTGSWVQIADAPLLNGKAKIGASAVTCGAGIYLIGGYTIGGPEVTDDRLFEFDPVGDSFIERSNVGLTEVDDTVAVCYQDRYIYLMSGWHGPINANVNLVQVYDTLLDSWQQATPMPLDGRFGAAGGIVGNRLVFIDGARDTGLFAIVHSTYTGTIDPADPTLIAWTQPAPSPYLQTYRAANSIALEPCGQVIFVGGTDNSYNFTGTGYNGQPSNPLDQVMTYNPVNDQWTLVDDSGGQPHAPTMDHRGLVWFDEKWVTVGGMRGPGIPTPAVNALSVPAACAGSAIPAVSSWGVVVMLLMLVLGGVCYFRAARPAPQV